MMRVILAGILSSSVALGQESTQCQGTCVPNEDMKDFLQLLQEKKCLQTEKPKFELEPVTLVIDKDGRIFFSGAEPHPYKLRMTWCSYEVEAEGKVNVLAAVQEPPTWGFQLRPKAYLGYLLAEPLRSGKRLQDGVDAGLMVDFFRWQDFNLNAHVGFRSFGANVGLDLTRNFGVSLGYGLSWEGFQHNPFAALWFSF